LNELCGIGNSTAIHKRAYVDETATSAATSIGVGRAQAHQVRALTESGQQLSPEKAVRSQSILCVRSAAGITHAGSLNRR